VERRDDPQQRWAWQWVWSHRNDAVYDWLPQGALGYFLEVCEEHGHDLLWRVGLGSFSTGYLMQENTIEKLGLGGWQT
jgi:hypothetical protein